MRAFRRAGAGETARKAGCHFPPAGYGGAEGENMPNLIAFVNAFLSYLLVFGVSAAVIGAAVWIGIRLRRKKNEKTAHGSEDTWQEETAKS